MVYIIADNILSPLGGTTEQNLSAVLNKKTALRQFSGKWNLPESFCSSLLYEEQNKSIFINGLTHFESMAVYSIKQAVSQSPFDISSPRVALIVSTTKSNVDLLERKDINKEDVLPSISAHKIASKLGIVSQPIVVCNACISGVSAIIIATRLLEMGIYEYAIVCGADSLNRFVVSGFQSLKALSQEPCRPFDIERNGLNLGEAAATIVLGRAAPNDSPRGAWFINRGIIKNDSFHISTPSNRGEGAYLALKAIIKGIDTKDIAFINAHGTATLFNDQMESIAIERAGLSSIPVNAYKGFYGHTMGASGVLETILSMKALDSGIIIGTNGFNESGVSGQMNLVSDNQASNKVSFIKMISGFGGCNAAILLSKGGLNQNVPLNFCFRVSHKVRITPTTILIDGNEYFIRTQESSLITSIYKQEINDYPRFYKMDMLSRLGFVASELLLKAEGHERFQETEERAIILFNRSSSLISDEKYQESIEKDNYYPSPSVFVYTLPNIVAGEIAIRNHYHGETSFYILNEPNEELMNNIIRSTFIDNSISSIISGWLDYYDDNNYIADLRIVNF